MDNQNIGTDTEGGLRWGNKTVAPHPRPPATQDKGQSGRGERGTVTYTIYVFRKL